MTRRNHPANDNRTLVSPQAPRAPHWPTFPLQFTV